MGKKAKDRLVSVDATINITIQIPRSELDALKEEAKNPSLRMMPGNDWESEYSYLLDEYIEGELILDYLYGDAWVCSIDSSSEI